MSRAIFFLFPLFAWPQAGGVLTHESDTQFILQRRSGTIPYVEPRWCGSQLLTLPIAESRELIIIATPATGLNEEVRFQMDGWLRLHAVDVWGNDDGSIVLTGFGTEDDGTGASFLGWIAADHKIRRIVRIEGGLLPAAFTVEPSGDIMAIAANKPEPPDEHSDKILTRFDPTGKVLSATKLDLRAAGNGSIMIASATRVSWLTGDNHYYEFSMDGTLAYQAAGPPRGESYSNFETRMAVSLSGTVMISRPVREKNRTRTAVYALDRLHKTWYEPEIAKGSPPVDQIYGFDGNALVTGALVKDLGYVLRRYKLSDKP